MSYVDRVMQLLTDGITAGGQFSTPQRRPVCRDIAQGTVAQPSQRPRWHLLKGR